MGADRLGIYCNFSRFSSPLHDEIDRQLIRTLHQYLNNGREWWECVYTDRRMSRACDVAFLRCSSYHSGQPIRLVIIHVFDLVDNPKPATCRYQPPVFLSELYLPTINSVLLCGVPNDKASSCIISKPHGAKQSGSRIAPRQWAILTPSFNRWRSEQSAALGSNRLRQPEPLITPWRHSITRGEL